MSNSIYLLDDNNFKTFDNHSAGDNIELRVEGPQEVKGEIKITNDLDYLKENGVIFYSYQDREKVGIPKTDKYLVQGILKTYLWKIEGREEEDFQKGDTSLITMKQEFPKYNELLEILTTLIKQYQRSKIFN